MTKTPRPCICDPEAAPPYWALTCPDHGLKSEHRKARLQEGQAERGLQYELRIRFAGPPPDHEFMRKMTALVWTTNRTSTGPDRSAVDAHGLIQELLVAEVRDKLVKRTTVILEIVSPYQEKKVRK